MRLAAEPLWGPLGAFACSIPSDRAAFERGRHAQAGGEYATCGGTALGAVAVGWAGVPSEASSSSSRPVHTSTVTPTPISSMPATETPRRRSVCSNVGIAEAPEGIEGRAQKVAIEGARQLTVLVPERHDLSSDHADGLLWRCWISSRAFSATTKQTSVALSSTSLPGSPERAGDALL